MRTDMHHYDAWGWYTAAELPGRATDAAPPTTSETAVPGQPRANWQGNEWAVWPYAAPPAELPGPKVVPHSVSTAHGSAALIMAGLWTPVLDYVEAIEDPVKRALAEVTLHKTTEWRRDNGFLGEAAAALGLSEGQVDDLFIVAAEIVL